MSKFSDRMRELTKATEPEITWTRRPEVLLSGRIPPPMHGVAPRVVMGKAWWEKERREAAGKTHQHCIACGVSRYQAKGPKWLEGHELYDIDYKKCRMVYLETVPLCHFCHSYVHLGLLQIKVQRRRISQARYIAIVQHGDSILLEAGLDRIETVEDYGVWNKWRMVLQGREYPPRYSVVQHRKRFGS